MTIRIGYACINTTLASSNRTCRLVNATPERVIELGRANLQTLMDVLRWNDQHGIAVFRISSDLIPLASHPANRARWWEALAPELTQAGALIRETGARVSMHPGQYTVINSPRAEVVESALAELDYHAQLLDALGTDESGRLVIHLGGVYGDKTAAMERFTENFSRLSDRAQRRVVLENDEKSYSLADALALSERLRALGTPVPVVFDLFHHQWNPSLPELPLRALLALAGETWYADAGRQKIHFSNPWPGKPPGSHSQTVDLDAFDRFYAEFHNLALDVMLEVKDKERSVLAIYERLPELRRVV